MSYNYSLIKHHILDNELGDYDTFGISVTDEDNVVLDSIYDVSVDYDTVVNIVSLCNELSLEPIHLTDVVEDMITNDV